MFTWSTLHSSATPDLQQPDRKTGSFTDACNDTVDLIELDAVLLLTGHLHAIILDQEKALGLSLVLGYYGIHGKLPTGDDNNGSH